MNNSENKTDSFLTQEAKDVIQELLEINSGGGGGGTSDYDDLTNKPSINGVSLSGDMSADDLGLAETSDIPDISGLYTKPNDGIPKSDLASDVKTSLGKADTALQSFTETDPTVPSWAKAVNKPTYTASEVGALPVGTAIPSIDNTLTTQGAAADAKATGDAISGATNAINNINSEISEMVKSVNSVSPDANGNVDVAVDQTLVDNWLDEHPEATTTVQDGSITYSKLNSEVSGDISGLKNALNSKPEIKDSDATGVDLDVSDPSGNVIMRLAGGHIQTKEFDSTDVNDDIADLKSGKIDVAQGVANAGKALVVGEDGDVSPENITIELDDTLTQQGKAADAKAVGEALQSVPATDIVKETIEEDADLYISDNHGNVIASFQNGGIQTKRFDSSKVPPAIETFSTTKVYTRGSANTLTINEDFNKGDEIYFHLSDGNRYDAYGRYASYYEGNKLIFDNRRGSNGYVRHIISADCSSVGILVGSTEYTDGTSLTLYVYRKNGEVKPQVVTIKTDGTGMFTTIKAAVDSITNANHVTNPYIIEVYPGTYNTLEGFTEEEIQSADEGGGYNQDTMVGVKLTDGISMIGVGRADDIILTAELNDTDYSSGVRGNISTLNIGGEGNLENMTIIGKNIRYCVHDDFGCPINSHDRRVLRNLKFKGEYLAYYPLFTTYGAGMTAPRDYLIENCDFGYDLGIHSNSGYTFGCTIEVNNCSGTRFRLGDSANVETNAKNRVIINNCNFQMININHGTSGLSNHMPIEGTGNEQSMIKDLTGDMYRLGMIDLIPKGIATGKMVKRVSGNLTYEVTIDKAVACGVVIGSDIDFAYVQKCGYIASNYLGLTGLSIGDYLAVDNSGSVVSGGTISNAVAVVKTVDSDGIAYAQLLI